MTLPNNSRNEPHRFPLHRAGRCPGFLIDAKGTVPLWLAVNYEAENLLARVTRHA